MRAKVGLLYALLLVFVALTTWDGFRLNNNLQAVNSINPITAVCMGTNYDVPSADSSTCSGPSISWDSIIIFSLLLTISIDLIIIDSYYLNEYRNKLRVNSKDK